MCKKQTIRVYQEDVLQKSCVAVVTACRPAGEQWEVSLDRTVFFPEGGGQLSDTGTIGTAVVSHVREQEGEVWHLCNRPLEPGTTVEAALDWQVRLDHMQQHTGEHILSHALWSLWGANNVGFHMGDRIVTIDMDRELTDEEIAQAEQLANQCIWEDRPVRVYEIPHTQLSSLHSRKSNEKLKGMLRIVEVEGGDICTCCGTHVPHTGMVGIIKVLRQERNRGGSRIEFLCGRWALEDLEEKTRAIYAAGALLSVKPGEVPEAVRRMKENQTQLSARLKAQAARLSAYRCRELLEAAGAAEEKGGRVVCAAEEDCSPQEAKSLLQQLTAGKRTTAVVLYPNGERINYLIGKSKDAPGSCKFIAQLAGGLLSGKGGGSDLFAQGSGPFCKDWQERAESLRTAVVNYCRQQEG
ncbi:alanyl-tRNA editing protein [Angelakisella massiliensis]|uniref:alanyl-tRNA editing protein n=1 Tax=Angelakisella massiliensis TaxID=1871018 RepID=UPI0024B25F23|nr:alanyl-tRNA editing protein [Angelakisella massiliensis]